MNQTIYYPNLNLVAKDFVLEVIKKCGNNMTVNGEAITIMINEFEYLLDTHNYRTHFQGYMENQHELKKMFEEYKKLYS